MKVTKQRYADIVDSDQTARICRLVISHVTNITRTIQRVKSKTKTKYELLNNGWFRQNTRLTPLGAERSSDIYTNSTDSD